MKLTIIGAGGVRTPLLLKAIQTRQDRLGLKELSLMDIDDEHLQLIYAISQPIEESPETKFRISRTTDASKALADADFVITTFRVGGSDSRVIDERVPLNHGTLGQETTGAGGFAMGIRAIPVILDYIHLMEKVCPDAWLINFANPTGMLTEAIIRNSEWKRVVGICDAPTSMQQVISAMLGAQQDDVYLDYFGLNHLGWIKAVIYRQQDRLPHILSLIKSTGQVPGLPFDADFIINLGMIPNEYLFYYYYAKQAIINILKASESRGEKIARQSKRLFTRLKELYDQQDLEGMQIVHQDYLKERSRSYMVNETGSLHALSSFEQVLLESVTDSGYAGVALNLIEGLIGKEPKVQIVNIPNQGSIIGMDRQDVVEIPVMVRYDQVQPMTVGYIPEHCLGLMREVKHYEQLTIEAAVEGSYQKAHMALAMHPLIRDYTLAGTILDDYITKHQGYFPILK
jgi:alpha-galactosidase/6-phospho-beta-glucosidase family protein